MGRHYDVRWHAQTEAWRSDCGELYTDKSGRQRRKTMTMRYPDGRKVPRSDKPAAMAALARRIEQLQPVAVGGFTVRQVAELFLYRFEQRVLADQAAEKTYRGYTYNLTLMVKAFGRDKPAQQVRAADLEEMVDRWKSAGKRPSTINHMITAVCACFSWAARPISKRGLDAAGNPLPEQLIPTHPFREFPRLPVPQSPPKYASRAEVAAFLRWVWNRAHPERIKGPFAIGPVTGLRHGPDRRNREADRRRRHMAILLRTIFWTGCRPSEACRALWTWIDWDSGVITIPPNRHKTGRKTGKARRIYLPPILIRALRRLYADPGRHPEHIFSHRLEESNRGDGAPTRPWTSEYLTERIYTLRQQAIAAGVPLKNEGDNRFHLYRLRHTRASDGLMRGVSEATVAEVLGTSADQIRKTYGHLLDGHTAQAAMVMVARPSVPKK